MRKTLIIVLTALTAALAIGTVATPAFADDPAAVNNGDYYPNMVYQSCATPMRSGVYGQYGAWGYFVDGCTSKVSCPLYAVRCSVQGHSYITTDAVNQPRVTQNMRLRWLSTSGAVKGWQDSSCDGYVRCYPGDRYYTIGRGEGASVQCNGVRAPGAYLTKNVCFAIITYLYN